MREDVQMQIKPASESDVALVLEFIRELAEYEKVPERVVATEDRLRQGLFGERRNAEAVIAYIDDQPVAFAIYFFSFSSFSASRNLYLEDIFVRPAYRGLKVGKRLLAYLAQKVVEHDGERMEWSVLNWNEPAIGFYKKLGAHPVSEWTVFHLPQDALKELTALGDVA